MVIFGVRCVCAVRGSVGAADHHRFGKFLVRRRGGRFNHVPQRVFADFNDIAMLEQMLLRQFAIDQGPIG